MEGRAGVRGAAPVEFRGDALAGRSGGGATRLSRNDLKMFHEQILLRNIFFSFCHSMNSLSICSYRCRDFAGKNLLPMILSASAFNSCMIEFSDPDFNERIIKNIISLFLSFSNIDVVKLFSVCNGSSISTAVNISRTRRERTFVAVLHFHFMTLHSTDAQVNLPGKSTRFRTFLNITKVRLFYFRYYYFTVCCISAFSSCPTCRESRYFRCQCRVQCNYFPSSCFCLSGFHLCS